LDGARLGPKESPLRKLEELPLVLTIEEAAEILRISRWAAYEQARIWRETGGRRGLPVLSFGRSLRVSRSTLEEMLRPEAGVEPPSAGATAPQLRAIQ
jgi:hypothetical protein